MPHENMHEIIESTAADWAARIDAGTAGAEDVQRLEAWLAENVLHQGAYVRAQAALELLDSQFASRQEDEIPLPAPRLLGRRRALWLGGGIAAAAASVAAFIRREESTAVTYTARRGEIRPVTLPDGSTVTLDTSSAVIVDFQRNTRSVELIGGRALFEVAKDRSRPFIVSAGGVKVRAVGTGFSVRKYDAAPVEVLVEEGVVEVGGAWAKKPVSVEANMRAFAPISAGKAVDVVRVDPTTVSQELSWQRGMLAFEDVTLTAAATEFSRYSDTRIVFSNPETGLVTISGLFAANNPEGFARAAAVSLGLSLDVKDGEITLGKP